MEIGSFSVFIAIRCAMFCTTCLLLFSSNIDKRRAVEPSDFWRNRRTLNKQIWFSNLCVCVFVFLIFLLTFEYSLPIAWARLAPSWIDFDVIFGPIFVAGSTVHPIRLHLPSIASSWSPTSPRLGPAECAERLGKFSKCPNTNLEIDMLKSREISITKQSQHAITNIFSICSKTNP